MFILHNQNLNKTNLLSKTIVSFSSTPLMEAYHQIMKLFDSNWFELEVLKKKPSLSSSRLDLEVEDVADHENEEQQPSKVEALRIPSLITRTKSEDLSFINCGSFSPDSVLQNRKESTESMEDSIHSAHVLLEHEATKSSKIERSRRRRNKSLTELQFEELKGFMDLGFVFSEEDKDSNLAAIIPGLKKLAVKNEAFDDEEEECEISRPYLSEAWEVMEKRKQPLMLDLRFPSLSNEMDMKDNLRWWAHTVASTVR